MIKCVWTSRRGKGGKDNKSDCAGEFVSTVAVNKKCSLPYKYHRTEETPALCAPCHMALVKTGSVVKKCK
jgi:hypothetical protein